MPCDSSTFSGESVEYQLSKAMWKPSRYWARPAAMLGHEFLRRHAFLLGGDHDRGAVGIVGADEVHHALLPVVLLHSLEADPDVGLDVFHHVADVEGGVGVGQGGGDEQLACHGRKEGRYG
jgi:hypothetical protein